MQHLLLYKLGIHRVLLLIFSLFIASLIEPKAWSVYLGSVVIGYGASGNSFLIYMSI